ncbi:MAG: hypothetical protein H6718_21425 [Polyangiaceae bacterium]|nr:hypothetical protein [Myxococcales bacterium]MCB9587981.1 hypothetical protein [Polyangiaceae bacterium]
MIARVPRTALLLWFSICVAALFSACGDNASVSEGNGGSNFGGNAGDAGSGGNAGTESGGTSNGGTLNIDGGGSGGTSQTQGFQVTPTDQQVIQVPFGTNAPTVSFDATFNGSPVGVGWAVDRGDIGSITLGTAETGVFTPTGKVGGLAKITAGLNGETREREVLVQLTGEQNGADPNNPEQAGQIPTDVGSLTEGGGIGGVGGDGLGGAVTDTGIIDALGMPSGNGSAEGLKFLYPYDNTVFPRGILAPIVSWDWSIGDADAIQLELATQSGSFAWKGTFSRPAILVQTGGKFIRHPIPQDVWKAATNTAGGNTDRLTLKLTVASGGQAYGPIAQTWTIAPARLSGIIYYNSYGTNLAQNLTQNGVTFGGATLSIRVGDSAPKLVAGATGGTSQCRVCHSVAADGSRLVTQHGDNSAISSSYDLTPTGATETPMAIGAEFPGMYPDGSMALAPNGNLLPLPAAGAPLVTTGITDSNLGTPAFSPDGKLVVLNPGGGTGQQLVVMDFDQSTLTFSNRRVVADDTGGAMTQRPGWGAFLPDNKSLVYHWQTTATPNQAGATVADGQGADLRTRRGARAQVWWTNLDGNTSVTHLDKLNGVGYLPSLPTPNGLACEADGYEVGSIDRTHSDDANYNYEPTVNPIPGGGYAWVVFTSRRMYGNVATIPPFCSDPRWADLKNNITTKKLWVAAVDLSAAPGTDASHPAFYLPGQELLAGNSRGFWVLDPCRADGTSCESGDQCCNGFCQPNSSSGELECSNKPPGGSCSQVQEKCETAADCCDKTNECINGFCAQGGPR